MSFESEAREHIASRRSAGTKSLYALDLSRWLAFCKAENVDPEAPTLTAATNFRDGYLDGSLCEDDEPMSEQTVRRMLSALSSMYSAAGLANVFNGKRLARPSSDQVALTEIFAEGEALRLIEYASSAGDLGVRDAAVLQVLYDTGLRISAVLGIRRAQITRRDGHVTALVKIKKKGLAEVELSKLSVTRIDAWLTIAPQSVHVFPSDDSPSSRIGSGAINKRIKKYGKALGIKHAHPHRFRATFITEALDAGIPLHKVQASVHHADPKTTQRYDRRERGHDVAMALGEFRKAKR